MSIYDTARIGASDNQIVFNDYSTYPIFRIQAKAPTARQVRELDIPIPFESGISDFETLIGRMAYVIQGKMYPNDEASFSTGLAQLRKLASLDFSQNDSSTDTGYVPFVYSENGTDNRQIFLKVLYVDTQENTKQGLVQPFRLICKIKDPTIYGGTLKTATTQGTDAVTSGGSAVFPVALGVVFGASTISVTSTATNSGDVKTYPASIKVVGPVNNPTITNTTSGEYITVNENLASSSNVLTITYDKDSVSVDVDGNSKLGSVASGSTWFKLAPGGNQITLSGSSVGTNAYVEVTYYDAYALS